MTKKEFADKNIGITFDFLRRIVDEPAIADTIPDGAELDFIDKDMPLKVKPPARGKKIMRYKVGHVFEPVRG